MGGEGGGVVGCTDGTAGGLGGFTVGSVFRPGAPDLKGLRAGSLGEREGDESLVRLGITTGRSFFVQLLDFTQSISLLTFLASSNFAVFR